MAPARAPHIGGGARIIPTGVRYNGRSSSRQ